MWRGVLSSAVIVVAALLVPVSIVSAWARTELVDETAFVATFAPLAQDPAVQALIVDEATVAIDESLDLQGLTDDLFDGLGGLDLPPRATAAIDLLRGPAVEGLRGLIGTSVTQLVESDLFASVWETALRASHRGLAAAATGTTPTGAVTISDAGEVGISLAPIIDEVKERLVAQGVGFASAIPCRRSHDRARPERRARHRSHRLRDCRDGRMVATDCHSRAVRRWRPARPPEERRPRRHGRCHRDRRRNPCDRPRDRRDGRVDRGVATRSPLTAVDAIYAQIVTAMRDTAVVVALSAFCSRCLRGRRAGAPRPSPPDRGRGHQPSPAIGASIQRSGYGPRRDGGCTRTASSCASPSRRWPSSGSWRSVPSRSVMSRSSSSWLFWPGG